MFENDICNYNYFAGVYLTCTMAITTMAMVATVFVLNLYAMKEKPVPKWAKHVFITCVARLLCMCDCSKTIESMAVSEDWKFDGYEREDVTSCDKEMGSGGKGRTSNEMGVSSHADRNGRCETAADNIEEEREIAEENTEEEEDIQMPAAQSKDKKADFSQDWIHVASVFDRLFFWICLIFIVLTTLILFHHITTSRLFKIPALDKGKP